MHGVLAIETVACLKISDYFLFYLFIDNVMATLCCWLVVIAVVTLLGIRRSESFRIGTYVDLGSWFCCPLQIVAVLTRAATVF